MESEASPYRERMTLEELQRAVDYLTAKHFVNEAEMERLSRIDVPLKTKPIAHLLLGFYDHLVASLEASGKEGLLVNAAVSEHSIAVSRVLGHTLQQWYNTADLTVDHHVAEEIADAINDYLLVTIPDGPRQGLPAILDNYRRTFAAFQNSPAAETL